MNTIGSSPSTKFFLNIDHDKPVDSNSTKNNNFLKPALSSKLPQNSNTQTQQSSLFPQNLHYSKKKLIFHPKTTIIKFKDLKVDSGQNDTKQESLVGTQKPFSKFTTKEGEINFKPKPEPTKSNDKRSEELRVLQRQYIEEALKYLPGTNLIDLARTQVKKYCLEQEGQGENVTKWKESADPLNLKLPEGSQEVDELAIKRLEALAESNPALAELRETYITDKAILVLETHLAECFDLEPIDKRSEKLKKLEDKYIEDSLAEISNMTKVPKENEKEPKKSKELTSIDLEHFPFN